MILVFPGASGVMESSDFRF
jgi:competence ComEA-like helix-hairpin-helix protein